MMPGADFPDQYPPQDGPIQDFPRPQGGMVPIDPNSDVAPQFDINQWYQSQFGRAPDANEVASDTENIGKYGVDAYKSDFQKRLDTRTPAQKGYAPVQQRSVGEGGSANNGMDPDLVAALKGLFPGGGFNQDIVNRRTDNVRDQLNRFRTSQNASNRASLANRGLIGSGPEITAQNRMEQGIADQFQNAVSGIYADESQNADSRMMQALGLFGGLGSDANRLALDRELGLGQLDLGWGRLGLDQTLGLGNLALGNMNGTNDYNLGLARLGLDRDRLQHEIESGNIDQIIQILSQWLAGANSSAGGYI